MKHISDHDLELYDIGMMTDDDELAALEEHYLGCQACAMRAEESAGNVEAVRAAVEAVFRSLARRAAQYFRILSDTAARSSEPIDLRPRFERSSMMEGPRARASSEAIATSTRASS